MTRALVLLLLPLALPAQEAVDEIYRRVAATFQLRDGRQAPELVVRPFRATSPVKGAYFDPENRRIVIDRALVERYLQSPALGADAVAFILAHELGHFYRDHSQVYAAAQSRTGDEMQRKAALEEQRRAEQEADRAGLWHSHLAGYRGCHVAAPALRLLYTLYGLPEQIDGYPDLEARVGETSALARQLEGLLPLYDLAVTLMLRREWSLAALVLEDLRTQFASPDLRHNAAVLQALEGLERHPQWGAYAGLFPFRLQTANHLARSLGRRGGEPQEYRPFLQKARRELETLHEAQPQEPLTRLNLALVQGLLGDPGEGMRLLEGLPEMDAAAQAILLHLQGRTEEARRVAPPDDPRWASFSEGQPISSETPSARKGAPCDALEAMMGRVGYGSSVHWSEDSSKRRLPLAPGLTYPPVVQLGGIPAAAAALINTGNQQVRVVQPAEILDEERAAIEEFAAKHPGWRQLPGRPVDYRLYEGDSCSLVAGLEGGRLRTMWFVQWD